MVLLLIGATCDLFDGLVARRFRASAMGAELDNLADVISFGFAPAFMVVIWGWFHRTAAVRRGAGRRGGSVLVAGVVRLARFACVKTKSGDFMGLPIPMGAMTVVSIVLLFQPTIWTRCCAVFGVAWLMVSRIEYPKPKGQLAAVVLAWIMINVAFLTIWAAWPEGGDTAHQDRCHHADRARGGDPAAGAVLQAGAAQGSRAHRQLSGYVRRHRMVMEPCRPRRRASTRERTFSGSWPGSWSCTG